MLAGNLRLVGGDLSLSPSDSDKVLTNVVSCTDDRASCESFFSLASSTATSVVAALPSSPNTISVAVLSSYGTASGTVNESGVASFGGTFSAVVSAAMGTFVSVTMPPPNEMAAAAPISFSLASGGCRFHQGVTSAVLSVGGSLSGCSSVSFWFRSVPNAIGAMVSAGSCGGGFCF